MIILPVIWSFLVNFLPCKCGCWITILSFIWEISSEARLAFWLVVDLTASARWSYPNSNESFLECLFSTKSLLSSSLTYLYIVKILFFIIIKFGVTTCRYTHRFRNFKSSFSGVKFEPNHDKDSEYDQQDQHRDNNCNFALRTYTLKLIFNILYESYCMNFLGRQIRYVVEIQSGDDFEIQEIYPTSFRTVRSSSDYGSRCDL